MSEGKTLLSFDFDRIPGRYPFVLFLPQNETERILTEHFQSLGGIIERGTELLSFRTDEQDVRAVLRKSNDATENYAARWLIGCDGAHSAVRRELHIPFEGDTVGLTFDLADLHLDGPDAPGDEFRIYLHHGDVVFIARLNDSLYRLISLSHAKQNSPDRDKPPTLADFQAAIDRLGLNIKASSPVWMTPFHINQRKAEHYREGNTFIAGDAAHIHSPVAGQGMNTGIQDAANLGWKLAAVSTGAAPELLGTYNEERGAVGDALLRVTSRGLAAATAAGSFTQTVRDVVISVASHIPQVQNELAGFISETAINYRHSPIVYDHAGDGSLRAGDRMPNPDITVNGRREPLLRPLQDGRHLLIGLNNQEYQDLARTRAPRASFVFLTNSDIQAAAKTVHNENLQDLLGHGEKVLVVRPDGYVGFRGRITEGHDPNKLGDYARKVGID